MNTDDRLIVNRRLVGPAGLRLEGELPASVLALPEDDVLAAAGPLRYTLRVTLVQGEVLVEGRASATFRGPCDRCGEVFELVCECDEVCHFFADCLDDLVDVTEEVREDVLLALPQKLVCAADCAGRCPGCGKLLAEGPCGCVPETPAPSAWSELDNLDL